MRTTERGLRFAAIAVTVAVTAFTAATGAQRAERRPAPPSKDDVGNFDVRTARDAASDGYLGRFVARAASAGVADPDGARATAIARLAAVNAIDVVDSPELGTTEVVSAKAGSGLLTGPGVDRVAALRAFLSANADVYGLSQDQVVNLDLVADYENPAGNMAWVELEQRINGLPVFRGLIRGGFTAKGELARTTGALASRIDPAALSVSPALTAAQAVSGAAANVGWSVSESALVQKAADGGRITFARGPMAADPKAWLLYFPLAPGVARLAWATEIWGDPDAFLVLLDAEDGTVLFRKSLTEYQSQTATYVIYADDSPAPMSPSTVLPGAGTQAPFISRTARTLVGNEAPNVFNSLGWMTDGTNSTAGNNVVAGIDRVSPDGVDAPVTGVNRVFDFAYNPQTNEPLTAPYQNGEVTDMFYATNRYHDRLYLLGFTEAARNFQNDNFGRGGLGGDRISAEAQNNIPGCGPAGCANNANFSVSPDGAPGRMQMYLFPGPIPARSSGLDHDVVFHELTHGTSGRLHADATGLSTTMSRGMGEGWSDFYARALLSSADENPNGIYSTGGWVTYQIDPGYTSNYYYGIRRFPYASIGTLGANGRPHNPLTFADIDPSQINTSDGAFPPSPIVFNAAFEVHNVGEVWASVLFEVRARFITRLGFDLGQQRVLQFVTDGMKLDPANPTLLQGRDAIIAAANAGGGTAADIDDIWAGFAARGMGVSAVVLNASTGAVVEAFDLPGITASTAAIVTESVPNGHLDQGESVTMSLCIVNPAATTSGSVTGTLLSTGGVALPSGPQSFGAIAAGATVCRNYSFIVQAPCGATLTANLQAQESGRPARNLQYSFEVGVPVPLFTQSFDTVVVPALPTGWTTSTLSGTANLWATTRPSIPDTAPNVVHADDPDTISDNVLVSPAFTIPALYSRMTFQHLFAVESRFDGGVLEIAIGGGPFRDIVEAGGRFVSGGYTDTIFSGSGSPIGGRAAWTGSSVGYITTVVNMPPVPPGQTVTLRWRMTSDSSVSGLGWSVDSIVFSTFQCVPSPAVVTLAATNLTATGATVRGTIDPHGFETTGVFEYGPTASYGRSAPASPIPGSATSPVPVSANLTGLICNHPYHVRVAATSLGGTASGGDVTFVTRACPNPSTDFDGDRDGDLTVFRPSTGAWWVLRSSGNFTTYAVYTWGTVGDVPVAGDYDGDGRTDIAVYRPSTGVWFVLQSSSDYTTFVTYTWGAPADVVVPGDYDGDGRTDPAVFRPSTGVWFILKSSGDFTTYETHEWGVASDRLVAGDYDGDGRTDLAVYRPSTGVWFVLESHTGYTTFATYLWGVAADVTVPGDYDGDGRTDVAVYRPATGEWFILQSSTSYTSYTLFNFGFDTDIPIPGDYDRDGKTDITVFRPSTGVWFIWKSSTSFVTYDTHAWGVSTDVVVHGRP